MGSEVIYPTVRTSVPGNRRATPTVSTMGHEEERWSANRYPVLTTTEAPVARTERDPGHVLVEDFTVTPGPSFRVGRKVMELPLPQFGRPVDRYDETIEEVLALIFLAAGRTPVCRQRCGDAVSLGALRIPAR
jgi:hypothetical protein